MTNVETGTKQKSFKRPRRTQEERRETTRRALIDATFSLLAETGYSKTTTTKVAHRAGVSLGAMQHHFGSKDELIMAALDHLLAEMSQQMAVIADLSGSLETRVENLVSELWSVYCSERYIAIWELFMGTRGDRHLHERVVNHRARSLRAFADLWVVLFEDAGTPRQTIVDVMHATLAMFRGFAFYSVFETDEAFFARERRLITSFILGSFGAGKTGQIKIH